LATPTTGLGFNTLSTTPTHNNIAVAARRGEATSGDAESSRQQGKGAESGHVRIGKRSDAHLHRRQSVGTRREWQHRLITSMGQLGILASSCLAQALRRDALGAQWKAAQLRP